MKKSQIVSLILFPIMVIALLFPVNYALAMSFNEDDCILQFYYNEIENSMDMLVLGPSTTKNGYIPTLAYEQGGMTSYSYSLNGFPIQTLTYALEETLKTQAPKLMVIDINSIAAATSKVVKTRSREYIKNLKDSDVKKNAKKEFYDEEDLFESNIPLIENHYNWLGILSYIEYLDTYNDRHDEATYLKGFVTETVTFNGNDSYAGPTQERLAVDKDTLKILDRLLKACDKVEKKQGTKFLFIRMPRIDISQSEIIGTQKMNYVGDYLIEQGYNYVDFSNLMFQAGENKLTPSQDFMNEIHLNYLGAEKFTKYFTSYIQEHYDFAYTHTQAVKEHWDNDCQKVAGYYDHLKNLLSQRQRTVCGELYFCKNFLNK